jgi:hypothetical protein
MNSSPRSPEQPFADDAGIEVPAAPNEDPYRALDELMAVIEVLCPVWPEREPFVDSGKMLL